MENLDSFLQKIQENGVEKAEEKAREIIESAKAKADEILQAAQDKIDAQNKALEQSKSENIKSLQDALSQAKRDLLLFIDISIQDKFKKLLGHKVRDLLMDKPELTLKWILDTDEKLFAKGVIIESVSSDLESFRDSILAEFQDKIESLEFNVSKRAGFRIQLKDEKVQLDYSEEAFTTYLNDLLRPELKALLSSEDGEEK